MKSRRKLMIGVIGAGNVSAAGERHAYRIGQLLAEQNAVLVCGGLGGVMEAAARGCAEAGGEVIGILPGADADAANPYVSLPIATNLGHARNVVIAHTAQALIAVEGEYGTLSEMAIGLKLGKPVIQLDSWSQLTAALVATSPEQAVALALSAVQEDAINAEG
ncbi:MAG TPA: TIGR00725 family protein [Malonomonas sp.]